MATNNELTFFQNLATNNPDLVIEATNNKGIATRANILAILNHNIMSGNIETGYRIWISSFIGPKFHNNEDKDREQSQLARYIRNMAMVSELSCHPMESGIDDFMDRVQEVATHLHQMHQWLLKGAN